MLTSLAKTKTKKLSLILTSVVLAAVFAVLPFSQNRPIVAQQFDVTQAELQDEITDLQSQIKQVESQLEVVENEAITLENKLAELRLEIERIQAEIDLTKATIRQLEIDIAEKQKEIDRRKAILSATFKQLYQRSNASALELLVASESFGEYLDTQEYLDRLKNNVATSVEEIIELKAQLQAEETKQKDLLSQQEAQEVALDRSRNEQQILLDETRGQEALFQAQLTDLQEQERQKEKELEEYLASLIASAVSLGPVSAGAVIGKLGNTGWSTGPHLHIQIYRGPGVYLEPLSTINSNGWGWPVGGSGGWVSQGYHGGHRAVDVAGTEGTPILAIAGGNIIHRGCLYTGSNYATFGVIIDHGNDYYSSYIHMQAPNNPSYSACNINRRVGGYYYGQPSIDYSTTN